MNSYQDQWGRYHDKPCKDGEPSSGNGWIYSAYAAKAGLPLNDTLLNECFRDCIAKREDGKVCFTRHPEGRFTEVPISRDEILGMAALGLLRKGHLNGWSFSPYPLPRFRLIMLIKQAKEAYGKHRNYLWLNGLQQLYRFAYSVPLQDRYFLLTNSNIESNVVAKAFYWAYAKVQSLVTKPKNGIHWLKHGGEKNKEIMKAEFPADHPLQGI
jgi:hypothetical protein